MMRTVYNVHSLSDKLMGINCAGSASCSYLNRKINYAIKKRTGVKSGQDELILSSDAKASARATNGRALNTKVNKSIDLKVYIDEAKEANKKAIENAGAKISGNFVQAGYIDSALAFRKALEKKYTILVDEAKTHSNPVQYIRAKYYDKNSVFYEKDLSPKERNADFHNEMRMYKEGKTDGVNFSDSLFRGIDVYYDDRHKDEIQFYRQLVNKEIDNIFTNAGINNSAIPDTCTFTVDPYSYRITVDGVSGEMKNDMENALNVGNNGQYLFRHINYCAVQDGCNSTQVSKISYHKYQAYQEVKKYTGLELDKLEEKDGTYYTDNGEDILDVVNRGVDASDESFKKQTKDWIRELVSEIAGKGWKNIPDMYLKIAYGKNGLRDLNQEIVFQYIGDDRSDKVWYNVM